MKAGERKERALEIIAREAAQFIAREAGPGSLITVIRSEFASAGDHVLVFVSIFPEDKMPGALAFLERHRKTFSDYLKQHTRLHPLPRVDFLLDNRSSDSSAIAVH